MNDSKKRLVEFKEPSERPSLVLAKKILEDPANGGEPFPFRTKNILDGYEDLGYTPNISQIKEWIDHQTEAMRHTMAAGAQTMETYVDDAQSDFQQSFSAALEAFSKNEINKDELAQSISEVFVWMDRSPFWGGTPLEEYWHAAKAQSALLRINKLTPVIIDVLYDLQQAAVAERLNWVEMLAEGQGRLPDANEFNETISQLGEKIQTALSTQEQITELAVKIGFLYRDSWWLEKHGEAALKGYIAKETAIKAGSGGSAASTSARRKRIDLFLIAHAKMIRENRILVNDPMEQVAFRALKLARKATPDIFGKTGSRRTAVEYWEYIKSDAAMWKKYQTILLDNKYLQD